MDVYQLTTICAACNAECKVILTNEILTAACENCAAPLLRMKRFDGVIYILRNQRVKGVKIGMTTDNAFKRAKKISGTGVPGEFEVLAAFPSNNPRRDERKVHDRLSRWRMDKEHFDLDSVVAITKVRTILGKDSVYIKRSVAVAVEKRIAEQRSTAAQRLKGNAITGTAQNDLFPDQTQETEPLTPERGGEVKLTKSKGFLANLFH